MKNPAVWWPYQMGTPHLETLTLIFEENGKVSDEQSVRFGIREITSELTDKGYRLFRVNGKPILIRGAGWSQDMLLRAGAKRLRDQFMLVRDMHLNTIRLEGKLETEDFFQLADEQGILVMLGWCCCDQWEHWDKWTPENHQSRRHRCARRCCGFATMPACSSGSMAAIIHLRPTWRRLSRVEAQTHWPNPTLSSASQRRPL